MACIGCNGYKYDKVDAIDSVSELVVALYHPRNDRWNDHFAWDETYIRIIGITPVGRATVSALRLNRMGLINLRHALLAIGQHPPVDVLDGPAADEQ